MNHIFKSQRLRVLARSLIISLLCFSMQACVKHQYKSVPVSTVNVMSVINSWSVDNHDLNRFLESNGVTDNDLNSNVFSIKRLYLTSLFYDPEMQVAYKKWQKAQK